MSRSAPAVNRLEAVGVGTLRKTPRLPGMLGCYMSPGDGEAFRHEVPLPERADTEFIASYNEKVTAAYREVLRGRRNVAFIQAIGVLASHRRQGIARKLVQAGLEEVDAAGRAAYVESTDLAVGLYEQLGFMAVTEVVLTEGYKQTILLREAPLKQSD
ncbi:hypothetical protein LTR37_003946 [Vermiconidia calcicola]|uniref:Uncharacterized protein n=1 Tax=Vermiconidia calcicola TaxID=1690605 RepID=A0ACC3NNC0_9PEZI|nr:hypothetical protein LTR37_003946 [Vermiconidia calcicola]